MSKYLIILPPDRPMTSHEIQQAYGRMPTKEERQAMGKWRIQYPTVYLSQRDADIAREADEQRASWEARMTPAERAFDALRTSFTDEQAELIKDLMEAMIDERLAQ